MNYYYPDINPLAVVLLKITIVMKFKSMRAFFMATGIRISTNNFTLCYLAISFVSILRIFAANFAIILGLTAKF